MVSFWQSWPVNGSCGALRHAGRVASVSRIYPVDTNVWDGCHIWQIYLEFHLQSAILILTLRCDEYWPKSRQYRPKMAVPSHLRRSGDAFSAKCQWLFGEMMATFRRNDDGFSAIFRRKIDVLLIVKYITG